MNIGLQEINVVKWKMEMGIVGNGQFHIGIEGIMGHERVHYIVEHGKRALGLDALPEHFGT